jgi:hypothetical protein
MCFCYEQTSPLDGVKERLSIRLPILFATSFYSLPFLLNRKHLFAVARAKKVFRTEKEEQCLK